VGNLSPIWREHGEVERIKVITLYLKIVMKPFLITFLIIAYSNSCFSQIVNLKDRERLAQTKFISIYEADRDSPECYDAKNVQIVTSNKISSCFRFKKRLGSKSTEQIIRILLNKSSFRRPDPTCFTTDLGMILFDGKQKMTGGITTSSSCNNLALNFSGSILTLTNKANKQLFSIIKLPLAIK